jgi:iron complex outermembrane receptor protein
MNNSKILLLFILLVFGLNARAQTESSSIKGAVYSQDSEPAMYSTVVLMNRDSVFMSGTLSDDAGSFRFDNLKAGSYHIMIRNVEFNTYVSELINLSGNQSFDLGSVKLETRLNNLDEVLIKGEKAMVEVHSDKMVYNVSATVNSTGKSAMELLSKSPGIRVDMDKNISLQGKSGVQIYINGRPSRISGSDLANMLEGMRSEDIESIEIISNPSAKYDAEGTGGIINILTKKDVSLGFNGNVNANYSKGVEPRTGVGTNLNYSGEKMNIFSSLNYSDNNYTFNRNEIMLREDYSMDMLSLRPTNRKGINFAGGIDYKINNENSLSFDARALVNDRNSPQSSSTYIKDLNHVLPTERLFAETIDDGGSQNYNANLHYSFTPNRSAEFTADVSYANYGNVNNTLQPNSYFTIDSILLRSNQSNFYSNTAIALFSTQLDFNKSYGKSSISTGVKYSYINTNNQLDYYDVLNGVETFIKDKSNEFEYLEKIASAYMIFNYKPTTKISINGGLRAENTSSLGELISNNPGPDDLVPRNYTSLFPNLSISYNDQQNHALSLSYGRRITRPDYQNLNPFESKISELSAWRGNPFLKPNYIDNYQLTYSFKRKLVISNTYSITRNYFANIFEAVGDKGNIIIPRNMEKAIVNGLSVSYPLKVTNWWEFSTFLLYNYESYQGDIEGTLINLDAHILDFRMQNELRIPGDFHLELSFYATSNSIWRGSLYIDRTYSVDLGVKREFLNKKLMIQAAALDIFDTGSIYLYHGNYGGMITEGDVFFDGRRVSLNLSYKFGNQKVKTRSSKSSLDEELNRISE